jgi:hypothetical protein
MLSFAEIRCIPAGDIFYPVSGQVMSLRGRLVEGRGRGAISFFCGSVLLQD